MGVRLKLRLSPQGMNEYTANFRCCCKYGFNRFVASYFDAITPYNDLLKSIFPSNLCNN